jgi:1-acyl-sn-glycerol-3-phosphate acyltransferase
MKTQIAAAIALSLVAGVTFAAPSFYGEIDVTADYLPEGTRKQAESIRSGFYRIAHGAQIPIVMFSFDYTQKTIHCLGVFHPTGHFEQDLEHILDLYIGKFSAKNPKWLAKPLQKRLKNS